MNKIRKIHIFALLFCLFMPFFLVGCENTNKNSLSTPSIVQVRGGTIVFNQVKDAEYYTISINNVEISVNAKHNKNVEIIDNLINYNASKILVVGESYSIKIKANSSTMADSNYSSTVSYKHSGSIQMPTDVKINGTVLTWGLVENASYYLVKVLTPNDSIVFDKNGNVLSLDDPESIANADLTEYSFNTNSFDFSSLLSRAGIYQFYVCTVLSNGSSYVESTYTAKVSYTHYEVLKTPVCGEIFKVDDNLHLAAAIDPNANEISIKCNGIELATPVNALGDILTKFTDNYFDINLTEYFAGRLDISSQKQLSISLQSRYSTANPETEFYTSSTYCDNLFFENYSYLEAPTLTVEDMGNGNLLATWSVDDVSVLSGYKLILFQEGGLKEFNLTTETTSMIISEEFIAVSVQAIEKGNYCRSQFSNVVSNSDESMNEELTIQTNDTTLSWDAVEDAYYVVEFNNQYHYLTENSFTIPIEDLKTNNFSIRLHIIKSGYSLLTDVVNINLTRKLNAPTFNSNQGFTSKNLYELSFTSVNGAIGYYVYIKSASSDDFEMITTLYTTTRIDLSNYICSKGEYTDYTVKVQAIADYNDIYSDSELSLPVSVSHRRVLDAPEFYRLNDTTYPVVKETSGSTTNYYLQFYGVADASSYEVLINFNKLTIPVAPVSLYKVDISNYLISANNYEIKIRAVPADGASNIEPSEYVKATYTLTKQLKAVETIKISENDGIYTLSFDPIDNAETYRARIVKENDSYYVDYLSSIGLSNAFEVTPSTDISKYVQEKGNYYIYVTALAPKNSYYADANESSTFGTLNKLTSLMQPDPLNIKFENKSKDLYLLSWDGDVHADYYLIKITDPNGISYETKVYNATSTNINQYITIQGTYSFDIYSMVETLGENAKEYTSSAATSVDNHYTYSLEQDFVRHSVSLYGTSYDFIVKNADDLKNLLWYHYLYEIDRSVGLRVMIKLQAKEAPEGEGQASNIESLREAIVRLSNEATGLGLHNFYNDETWLNLNTNGASDKELFAHICQKLLNIYPEFNSLADFSINNLLNDNIFELYYRNELNGEKIPYTINNIVTNTNYGNEFNYIDPFLRKSATGVFAIDSQPEALVTTSEQLVRVVQDGYKPVFIGDSATAQTIYSNAKLVLSAIVTNKMTDLEKITAIFDWLEAEFDLTYYNNPSIMISGSVENSAIKTYGKFDHYYLEGIFNNISVSEQSTKEILVGNRFATSWSYSKAFSLLCGIEGIKSSVVNGYYLYTQPVTHLEVNVDHSWNKVYVDTSITQTAGKSWYSVDLTFSDNRIYFNDLNTGYGISSHTYFLTADRHTSSAFNVVEESNLVSSSYAETRKCENTYDYYEYSTFGLTLNQLDRTILDYELYKRICSNCSYEHISNSAPDVCPKCNNNNTFDGEADLVINGFKYSKKFNQNINYQKYTNRNLAYGPATELGSIKDFYMNLLIYAGYNAKNNETKKSVIEFKISTEHFVINDFIQMFGTANDYYQLGLSREPDSPGSSSIYTVQDSTNKTTTVVCIVSESAI